MGSRLSTAHHTWGTEFGVQGLRRETFGERSVESPQLNGRIPSWGRSPHTPGLISESYCEYQYLVGHHISVIEESVQGGQQYLRSQGVQVTLE